LIVQEVNPVREDEESALKTFYDWTFQNRDPSDDLLSFKKEGVEMLASLNSNFTEGSFPVVLLIHGGAADFSFLGELLASHGYIAVNIPYKGFIQSEIEVDAVGMETEVKDFEFALEWLAKEVPLDIESISVVGASFGGQSAVSFSLRNKINCIVSFDGGIGSAFGAWLLQSDKNYDLKNIVTPLLHLYNPDDPYTDISFIRKYKHCDRTMISMKNMEHAHFWSWGILDRYIPNIMGETRPGNSYEAVLQETLSFIEKHTKKTGDKVDDWCAQFQNSSEHLKADKIPATSDYD
jgi:dienelactone hydrolase